MTESHDRLKASYGAVAKRTWEHRDFLTENLESSRSLFEASSLKSWAPVPVEVDVYAFLSGLPFEAALVESLQSVQQDIASILDKTLHYWVKPENLGIEYCVFKWPDEVLPNGAIETINAVVSEMDFTEYKLDIGGVQVNPDGCVVARGFDEDDRLFKIRQFFKDKVPFLPERQSGWAHIPLGRILEPVGEEKFRLLNEFFASRTDKLISSTKIQTAHLIHENRWYMEERDCLTTVRLG